MPKKNSGVPTNISGAREVQRKVAMGKPVPVSHLRATVSLLTSELRNMTLQAKMRAEQVEFLERQLDRGQR